MSNMYDDYSNLTGMGQQILVGFWIRSQTEAFSWLDFDQNEIMYCVSCHKSDTKRYWRTEQKSGPQQGNSYRTSELGHALLSVSRQILKSLTRIDLVILLVVRTLFQIPLRFRFKYEMM